MSTNQENIGQVNFDNDEISLKELSLKIKEWFAFLKFKWKIIFLAGILGGLIGLTTAFFVKPSYKAVLTFTMEEDKGGGGLSGAMGLASSLGIDLGGGAGGAFSATNIIELMKSRLIVEKALLNPVKVKNGDIVSFAEYYIQINKLRDVWDKKQELKGIQFPIHGDRTQFSLYQDSILQTIYKDVANPKKLNIQQKDKKISIISVDVISENELFAKNFCENIAKETSDFYVETKSKKARMNAEIIQKQVDSVRAELNGAISGMALASDNVYNLNPSVTQKTTPSKKRQIDVQANTAIYTQLVTQLELAKVSLRKETPLIQIIDRPILPLENNKKPPFMYLIIGLFLSFSLTVLFISIQKWFN